MLLILFQRNLVPTDEITVYYQASPEGDYLDTVIKEHTGFIFATIKAALKLYPVSPSEEVLIQEKTQLKGSELEITIAKGAVNHYTEPACAYVTLNICISGKEQGTSVLIYFLISHSLLLIAAAKHDGGYAGVTRTICTTCKIAN
uniref:Uncharacterized protein n=1 Tax=Laticauda laticaudata TaxID=8630 RepID=A0A8C5SJ80_LATLA